MFLWLSVISWGIGLGAKVFDLVVLARAWGWMFLPAGLLSLRSALACEPGGFFPTTMESPIVGVAHGDGITLWHGIR
jgi:hypothetical protein